MRVRLQRTWPFHRHRWREIERLGLVVTTWCPCGKTKTRVHGIRPDAPQNGTS